MHYTMPNSDQIQKGSVVRLKSGGPKMTITMKSWGGGFVCQWFEGAEVRLNAFPAEALVVLPDETGGAEESA